MPIDGKVEQASEYLRKFIPCRVRTGVVLGSGLGVVRDAFETVRAFPYGEIPHFPVSTVQGHRGELVLAKRGSRRVLIMDGRTHRYEGYSFTEVTLPVMVLRGLGVSTMIITNAAGAISDRLAPGDIMLVEDHIDLMWKGIHELSRGPQVLHKSYYSKRLLRLALDFGLARRIPVKTGILVATTGPSYETRSEVEFSRKIGADAATMSTIPEVTVCHGMGMAVLGISLITNVAASHGGGHEKVIDFAQKGSRHLQSLILGVADAV